MLNLYYMEVQWVSQMVLDLAMETIDIVLSKDLLDFSESFKKKRKVKRTQKNEEDVEPNLKTVVLPDLIEIPEKLVRSEEEMQERKYFDVKRWMCMSRPQYSKSCGITSLVSCWNFLFSTLGYGKLPVLCQEKALIALGIEPPFHNIRFGPFTGNNTLINWFNMLNMSFNIKGTARVFWKLHGKDRTEGVTKEEALKKLTEGLKDKRKAYIYHCFNHFMCPIGFEHAALVPPDAYKPLNSINPSELETFLIIAEASKAYPIFHIRKWDEVALDIDQQNPNYFNIRKPNLGIQARTGEVFTTGSKLGKNLHCIIEFESLEV